MIQKEITKDKALLRLSALCAKGEHCTGDLRQKMRQWGLSEQDAEAVLQRLVEQHFVDDGRYARAFVEDKVEYNGWGPRKIEQALKMKHVSDEIIDEALAEVTDEKYVEKLMPLARSKWRGISAETDYERSQKLIRWALGRGFTFDQIRKCIDNANEWLAE